MTWLGILLVAISACCHAAWNLLSKASSGPTAFSRQALRWSAICYAPLILLMQSQVDYSPRYAICILTSGSAVGLFFFSLSKAYQYGNVSVAYPIARSFPILVVTWVAALWGRFPSAPGLCGIFLIMAGCFILPMNRFSFSPDGFALRNYLNRSCAWALLAAFATSLFAIIDKIAAAEISTLTGNQPLLTSINYVYLQNVMALFVMELACFKLKQPNPKEQRPKAIIAGLIFLASYSLILIALISEPVAYVVSFRQISIVIAAVVSLVWLEKVRPFPRLVGIALIFTGVVLVGTA
jgi:uncharacterized membrane protein